MSQDRSVDPESTSTISSAQRTLFKVWPMLASSFMATMATDKPIDGTSFSWAPLDGTRLAENSRFGLPSIQYSCMDFRFDSTCDGDPDRKFCGGRSAAED